FIALVPQPRKKKTSNRSRTSAMYDLKSIAISRLMLHNFPHIKSYWINIGTQLTQLSMHFGASDIHGTLVEERISHSAGALTQTALTRRSEEHTSELQSRENLVCRLLLEKKKSSDPTTLL